MKRYFNCIELFIVIAVIATIMAVMIPAAVRKAPEKSRHAKCKQNLKIIGSTIAVRYEKFYKPQPMPVKALDYVQQTDFGGLLKDSNLNCSAGGKTYIWLTETYTHSAEKKLAGDSDNHDKMPHRYAVYEDGHVE